MSLLTVLQALEAPHPYPGAPEGLKTWWGSSLKKTNTKITGNLQGQQKSEKVKEKKRKFRQNFVETIVPTSQ